jgi:hypothetical protein
MLIRPGGGSNHGRSGNGKRKRIFVRSPLLQAKKMEGHRDPEGRDIWEARVTKAYRMTFVVEGHTYILRRVGPHDMLPHQ